MHVFETFQWYDFVRMTTASFAILSMWRLAKLVRVRPEALSSYSSRYKDFLWLFNVYLFVQCVGALEAAMSDTPYRYTILLSCAASIVSLRAVCRPKDREKLPL